MIAVLRDLDGESRETAIVDFNQARVGDAFQVSSGAWYITWYRRVPTDCAQPLFVESHTEPF